MSARFQSLLIFLLLGATSLHAATTGQLRIQITTEEGEPIDETTVGVEVPDTGQSFEKRSNARGRVAFQGLPGGVVILRLEKKGYQTLEKNARIEAGGTTRLSVELIRRLATRPTAAATRSQQATVLYNQAVAAFEAGDNQSAKKLAHQALSEESNLAPAQILIARLAEDAGDPSTAADALLAALEIDPQQSQLRPRLVELLQRAGRDEEATQQESELGAGTSAQELYDLAVLQINKGNETQAAEHLEKALASDPDFAPATYQLAVIRLQSGAMEESRTLLERYLALASDGELAADARALLEALGPR